MGDVLYMLFEMPERKCDIKKRQDRVLGVLEHQKKSRFHMWVSLEVAVLHISMYQSHT